MLIFDKLPPQPGAVRFSESVRAMIEDPSIKPEEQVIAEIGACVGSVLFANLQNEPDRHNLVRSIGNELTSEWPEHDKLMFRLGVDKGIANELMGRALTRIFSNAGSSQSYSIERGVIAE